MYRTCEPFGMSGTSQVSTVGPDALAAALGTNRAALYRARAAGKIPEPDRPTIGGFARWSVALAADIVRRHGKPVPAAWSAS
jgi:hypothetical protein